ncbi:MAG: TetR-like C-terminal domain-containing protein [Traorella sp.]
MDMRIKKTKMKMKEALLDLLETNDLSEISVSQLCQEAHINRSTFYVHYNNVMECFYEITDEILDEMRSSLLKEKRQNSETFLRVYIRIAKKHQLIFRIIHTLGIHNPMILKMVEIGKEAIDKPLFIPYHNENLEYSFLFSGFYGMIEAWLRNGCKESEDEISAFMHKIYTDDWTI